MSTNQSTPTPPTPAAPTPPTPAAAVAAAVAADTPRGGEFAIDDLRLAIFRGVVQWTDQETDDAGNASSRATFNGVEIRRVVQKSTGLAAYAILDEGRVRTVFPVADRSGAWLVRPVADEAWFSDPLEVERALVLRRDRELARARVEGRLA